MINFNEGIVIEITEKHENITKLLIELNGKKFKAINYKQMTGQIKVGDVVKINTTAMDLGLGTGGYHFVMSNNSNKHQEENSPGHIMKLRYTPMQMKVLAIEEDDSLYHSVFNDKDSIDGHLVIVASLHSMLAPLVVGLKYLDESININYIMTEGASLSLDFSDTVRDLKTRGLINKTITIGNGFGGDYEAVNIYSGLISSKWILNGDITIIAMGPGIVGTGTKFGFTGLEQGDHINAVKNLGGLDLVVPRISFADKRERHYGISHHTITTLTKATNVRGNIIFPLLDNSYGEIDRQILNSGLDKMHNIYFENGAFIEEAFIKYRVNPTTMGRDIGSDKEYFLTLGAVAKMGYNLFIGRNIDDFSRKNYEI